MEGTISDICASYRGSTERRSRSPKVQALLMEHAHLAPWRGIGVFSPGFSLQVFGFQKVGSYRNIAIAFLGSEWRTKEFGTVASHVLEGFQLFHLRNRFAKFPEL